MPSVRGRVAGSDTWREEGGEVGGNDIGRQTVAAVGHAFSIRQRTLSRSDRDSPGFVILTATLPVSLGVSTFNSPANDTIRIFQWGYQRRTDY